MTAYSYACAQSKQIRTIDKTNSNYYESITFLDEGEINWSENGGVSFRFVITTSEIYDAIYLEKAEVGEEGGGKKIVNKRLVDMQGLAKTFGLKGEITGIEFIKWVSWNSFEIKVLGTILEFENIDKELISVKKQ
jgi:hypothetical protein